MIKHQKPIFINEDYIETAKQYGDTEAGISKGLPPKSAIFVPMIVGDQVVGSISLQNVDEEHAFSESDIRLLTTLTNSMSVAIENARLFNETSRLLQETEQRAAELQTVNSISKAIVSQLEGDALFKLVGDKMKDTFKADIVYLAIHDQKTNMLHFPYYFGDKAESRPFGNGITEKIITSKEPLLVNQNLDKTYDKIKAEKKGQMVESYLGVPIRAGKHSLGVISVQSKEQENRFSESDQRLLSTIAANVGIAIQNAEAYQKLQSALEDLRAVQEQLVQQEKLASLGQLTAGIAHEIKNPLNFVNNFSDLSLELVDEIREEILSEKAKVKSERSPLEGGSERSEQGDDPDSKPKVNPSTSNTPLNPLSRGDFLLNILEILDDIEANLKTIHKHGTRADSIVKSMLQHSRGGDGKMEPTPLNPLIKEYVNLSFHGMRAGKDPISVDIDLQLDESIGEVPLIGEDFSRVILNLVNNAFDAMREKSEKANVKREKESSPLDGSGEAEQSRGVSSNEGYNPKLTVRTKSNSNTITIEIEDNGPGIPKDIKDKILQPFFTTKKGTAGTGLGLSITNDIVKAHGGIMAIQSDQNGSTIVINLQI